MDQTYPARDLVRERYTPFRAEHGKRLHFETADFRELHSPFDRSVITSVGYMTEAQARENLETLVRTFRTKVQPKTHERILILKRAAEKIAARSTAFADLIAWEGGKPLRDARIEVARAINSLEIAAEEAGRIHGHEVPMRASSAASGHLAFTYPEPIGVVLAISAFNHPLNLIAHQIAPAIAVGCPVMVKPALETPLSCLHFLEALYESGLAPEMCLPLICENKVAEKIARSPEIGFLTFIGSQQVGWHLRSVVAPGVRVVLEHGGSAPVLIDQGADLDRLLPLVVRGGYYHSGQVCVSVQRIYVHEQIIQEFEERFIAAVRNLKTGDPRLETTDCGPIIRERDLLRIEKRIEHAVGLGAKVLLGGVRLGETCFKPTIVRGAPHDDPLVQEEIFGPVTVIETFRDLQRGIERANQVPWKFQSAIFTSDLERALTAARDLDASAVMVNESTAFRVDWMPFRGDGPSGLGTGGIAFTMREMTREKMITFRSPAFAL